MRVRYTAIIAGLFTGLFCGLTPVDAQETVNYETGPNGVTYKVTRRVTQQLVPVTEMQTREEKVLRPRTNTQLHSYQQSYLTPVTEYRWVSRMRGRWNPFVQPYWAQKLEPFTRWESHQATMQIPTTSTEWVEEKRTVQTPVVTYRSVPNETVSKVAVSMPTNNYQPSNFSPAPNLQSTQAPLVASRPLSPVGGQRMQSDPPRAATGWRSQDGTLRR